MNDADKRATVATVTGIAMITGMFLGGGIIAAAFLGTTVFWLLDAARQS